MLQFQEDQNSSHYSKKMNMKMMIGMNLTMLVRSLFVIKYERNIELHFHFYTTVGQGKYHLVHIIHLHLVISKTAILNYHRIILTH